MDLTWGLLAFQIVFGICSFIDKDHWKFLWSFLSDTCGLVFCAILLKRNDFSWFFYLVMIAIYSWSYVKNAKNYIKFLNEKLKDEE